MGSMVKCWSPARRRMDSVCDCVHRQRTSLPCGPWDAENCTVDSSSGRAAPAGENAYASSISVK